MPACICGTRHDNEQLLEIQTAAQSTFRLLNAANHSSYLCLRRIQHKNDRKTRVHCGTLTCSLAKSQTQLFGVGNSKCSEFSSLLFCTETRLLSKQSSRPKSIGIAQTVHGLCFATQTLLLLLSDRQRCISELVMSMWCV